jgi:hypothetical protein
MRSAQIERASATLPIELEGDILPETPYIEDWEGDDD